MSESTNTHDEGTSAWSPDNDPDGYTLDDISPKDWCLDKLLDFTIGIDDAGDGSLGITVQTGGAVISGTVISRAAWIDAIVQQVEDDGAEELAGGLRSIYGMAVERITETLERRDADDLPTPTRVFLHMKDARVVTGPGTNHPVFPLWRGTLSDITGWSLGVISS